MMRAPFLPAALVLLSLVSCIKPKASAAWIETGRVNGLRTAFVASQDFAVPAPAAFEALLETLILENGAQIVAVDRDARFLSWVDGGGSFVRLPDPSSSRRDVVRDAAGRGRSIVTWRGQVHGGARVQSVAGGSRLRLHVTSYDLDTHVVKYSDGSYERVLAQAVMRRVQAGKRSLPDLAFAVPHDAETRRASSFADAAENFFRGLPRVAREDFFAKGIAKVFPVEPERVWDALLDVASQLDVVCQLDPAARTLIVERSVATRDPGDTGVVQRPALLAIMVAAHGKRASSVYLMRLSADRLELGTPADLSADLGEDVRKSLQANPTELAAARSAEEIFTALATQALHRDRWAGKLRRRSSRVQ
jgi:hypothetical protein